MEGDDQLGVALGPAGYAWTSPWRLMKRIGPPGATLPRFVAAARPRGYRRTANRPAIALAFPAASTARRRSARSSSERSLPSAKA